MTDIIEFLKQFEWIIAFVIAWITILLTIRHFKTSKTISYIERLNTPEMAKFRADIDELLNSDLSDSEKNKIIENDKALFFKIKILINIFTEIGISYKSRIIRRQLTREIFYPMIPNYWDKFSFYILKQKNKGIAIGYYFEYITDEIKRIEGKNKKRIRKRYPYLFEKKEEN